MTTETLKQKVLRIKGEAVKFLDRFAYEWNNSAPDCKSSANLQIMDLLEVITSLEHENDIVRESLNVHPGVDGTVPLILYFDSRHDADEFARLIQEVKPGMRSYSL